MRSMLDMSFRRGAVSTLADWVEAGTLFVLTAPSRTKTWFVPLCARMLATMTTNTSKIHRQPKLEMRRVLRRVAFSWN